MTGKPEVFIIESLDFDDEREERFEGQIIKRILSLSRKTCEYYYIRTERELKKVLRIFASSDYRYLHLSCHGSASAMATTLYHIPFRDLGGLVRPHLEGRRLFISACSMTNEALADNLMRNSGCFSIVGPNCEINFADAAILWASFYHVMFAARPTAMKLAVLKAKAQEVANLFRVPLTCYVRDESHPKGYSTVAIEPEQERDA